MVYHFVRVVRGESIVGEQCIGIEGRASFDMLANLRLQLMLLAVRYNCGADSPAALKDSHHSSLILRPSPSNAALAFAQVHVMGLAADERFVHFYFCTVAGKFGTEEVIMDSKPKALQHEPCRLLCNAQSAMNIHAGNAILAVDQPWGLGSQPSSHRRDLMGGYCTIVLAAR
jgi:hypothetical protein